MDTSATERPVQEFLEKYPSLFPCGPRHIIKNQIISQFPLARDYVPDFAYLWFNSTGVYLELFEIESPQLQIFLKSDNFSKKYLAALQQPQDWLHWTKANQTSLFYTFAPLIKDHGFSPPMTVFCNLVAGRRLQLTNDLRRERYTQLSDLYSPNVIVMTYDRFVEQINQMGDGQLYKKMQCVTYKSRRFIKKSKTGDSELNPQSIVA